MADLLADQYAKVFSKPKQPQPQPNQDKTNIKIDEINITEDSIVKAINELSPSSSAGPDGFPAMFLKKCKDELSVPLCLLWKKSLEIGLVPTELKKCTITPIHKGGSRSLAANYRPVALTSHVIKIFEKILRNHIVNHMNNNDFFNPNQHGFRSGRSCLSQLLEQHDL
uniref:Reverse transcriptase domain-containing protein n=1 Tax=Clytia hemisphaerica TaxID=252671 RepID=A0A7M5UV05_9CNID